VLWPSVPCSSSSSSSSSKVGGQEYTKNRNNDQRLCILLKFTCMQGTKAVLEDPG
jgi:hypothetical protein